MGHSQADKARTHERIVEIAARKLREDGLEGIGVAELMKEAGLTVGGFYKHFGSRDELVAEALDLALSRWADKPPADFATLMQTYLSPTHRDAPGAGCAFAALGPDIARGEERLRDVATDHLKRNLDMLTSLLGDRANAILAYGAMIGALSLARLAGDETLSREILETVAAKLTALAKRRPSGAAPRA